MRFGFKRATARSSRRNGKPYGVFKCATDITAQKLRNADNEGKLDALDRSQGIIEFELDGTVVTANANFLAVVGYGLDEVKGKHHSMFVDGAERGARPTARVLGGAGPGRVPAGRVQARRQGWARGLHPGHLQPGARRLRPAR